MSNQTSPRAPAANETKNSDFPDASNESKSDSARSKLQETTHVDCGAGDVASQTRRETESNTNEPVSLTTKADCSPPPSNVRPEPVVDVSRDKMDKAMNSRNPITGMGLNGDGVGGLKPMKPKSRRDGNPVTGEGYNKSNDFNHTPSMNGANQIINKNRIPPGGYSSGLW